MREQWREKKSVVPNLLTTASCVPPDDVQLANMAPEGEGGMVAESPSFLQIFFVFCV